MTEKTKTAKKPTKPKNTAPKKASAREAQKNVPTHDEIARLAHGFWAERGYQHGHAEEDWHRAERELQSK